jgi:pimeloyl-ACP methyl ester carboxylesterase
MPNATTTQSESTVPALGICLEGYDYPYPVQFFSVRCDLQQFSMAYMDIPPKTAANGKTVVLFHGKAFGCYYFHNVIEALTENGNRVVAPDQLGWGKSPKPDIHYSFQLLAGNTTALLDHLGVEDVAVLGHSTGGMTAARFALVHPERVTHLVLEDPLGLTDYRVGIPPQSEETLYDHEIHWTDANVIRSYVEGYFAHPDPKVWEPHLLISPPTLLIVGVADHVVPLGQYAPPAEARRLGDFLELSAAAVRDIPNARRVVVADWGHIPHLEHPEQFLSEFLPFLGS